MCGPEMVEAIQAVAEAIIFVGIVIGLCSFNYILISALK